MESASRLLDPLFLFDLRLPLLRVGKLGDGSTTALSEVHRLPDLARLSGRTSGASPEVRIGWSPDGLAVSVFVRGKKQTAWCRAGRIEDSDGLQLVLDTRATPGVHRATRFAHRFVFTPFGDGPDFSKPVGYHLPVGRARENPTFASPTDLKVGSVKRADGYDLHAVIPAKALTGYDPKEYPDISLHYTLVDRERGNRTMTLSPEYPVLDDPTLWVRMRLTTA